LANRDEPICTNLLLIYVNKRPVFPLSLLASTPATSKSIERGLSGLKYHW
jgi:hypothetical protein